MSIWLQSLVLRVKRKKLTVFVTAEPTDTVLEVKQKLHDMLTDVRAPFTSGECCRTVHKIDSISSSQTWCCRSSTNCATFCQKQAPRSAFALHRYTFM